MLIHTFFVLMHKIMHCIHMNQIVLMSIHDELIANRSQYNHSCMLFTMLSDFILRVHLSLHFDLLTILILLNYWKLLNNELIQTHLVNWLNSLYQTEGQFQISLNKWDSNNQHIPLERVFLSILDFTILRQAQSPILHLIFLK